MSPAKDAEYPRRLARLFPDVSRLRISSRDITKKIYPIDEASFASMLSEFCYLQGLELITSLVDNPLPATFPVNMALDELYFDVGSRSAHVPPILQSLAHTTTKATLKRAIFAYILVVTWPPVWKQITQHLELFTELTHLEVGLTNYNISLDKNIPIGVDKCEHCCIALARGRA
jgi:hypothetical protein